MTEKAKPVEIIRQQLNSDNMVAQLQAALPTAVPVDKFNRVAMTVIQNNPDLLQADRTSLFSSIMGSAQLGLLPDPQLGEAYFTVFKKQVTLVIGYRGLLKLARQSGEIADIYAELVHENDEFVIKKGTERELLHNPVWGGDPGEIVGAYAVAVFKDGTKHFEAMTIHDIEQIRQNAFSKNSGAWTGIGYGEMCKKTVMRRLLKYLPLSTDPIGSMESEDRAQSEYSETVVPIEQKPQSRLEQFAAAQQEPETVVVEDEEGGSVEVDAATGEVL